MKMTDREVDGAFVLALDGRIVLGDESQALRVKLKSLIAEGKKKIVLNVDNIRYIDSAGLGILVGADVSAETQGASVKLRNLGSRFREVLQITKLLTVFDVYNTEAAATASFPKLTDKAGAKKPSVTLPGTVEEIIESPHPSIPEKAETSIQEPNELHQDIPTENPFTTDIRNQLRLKKGALVEVTVEAAAGATTSKGAST